MMELIRTIKKRQQQACERSINEEAINTIYVDDFDDKLFISYNGTPLIPIDDTWTPKEILKKLNETRDRYISYRMKKSSRSSAALL